MKKVFMMLAAVAALVLASCTNKAAEGAVAMDNIDEVTEAITKGLEAGDAQGVETLINNAKDYIAELQESAPEKVQEYVAKLQEFINTNADKIKSVVGEGSTIASALETIQAIPTDATNAVSEAAEGVVEGAENAVEGVAEDAQNAVDGAVQAGKDAVEAGKQAVDNTVEAGKQAVDNAKKAGEAAVENTKQAGKNAVNNAIDNAANSLKIK